MTPEQMRALATSLAEGGPAKKSEIVAFMKAYLATPAAQEPDPDLQAGGLGMPSEEVAARLPTLYFEIERTDSGIHVPRDVNRSYTKAEGTALLYKLAAALK